MVTSLLLEGLETKPSSLLAKPLAALQAEVANCTACALAQTRLQTVFADGNPEARLMVIGEAPGQQEDETGLPFVGRSGQLLTQMLANVGLERQRDMYIVNSLKCRPPGNRKPFPSELLACQGFLGRQLSLVKPAVVLLVGSTAVEAVLNGLLKPHLSQPLPKKATISQLRGQWLKASWQNQPLQLMPVFHPSYLLRNASMVEGKPRWQTRQDLLAVKAALEAL